MSSRETRSWRRTVARAVALAQWAVELDAKNTDPMGALAAYTESVRLLQSILARVERHGAHSEASQLSIIVRRYPPFRPIPVLNAHSLMQSEGYSERMRMLCVACAVPPPPYDPFPSEVNDFSSPAPPTLPPPPAYEEFSHTPRQTRATASKPLRT